MLMEGLEVPGVTNNECYCWQKSVAVVWTGETACCRKYASGLACTGSCMSVEVCTDWLASPTCTVPCSTHLSLSLQPVFVQPGSSQQWLPELTT